MILRQLVQYFLDENQGDRDATIRALYQYVTEDLIPNLQQYSFTAIAIREKIAEIVDQVIRGGL